MAGLNVAKSSTGRQISHIAITDIQQIPNDSAGWQKKNMIVSCCVMYLNTT